MMSGSPAVAAVYEDSHEPRLKVKDEKYWHQFNSELSCGCWEPKSVTEWWAIPVMKTDKPTRTAK